MEILIVFIIVAVLAAIAIPAYSKTVEKNAKRQAETYLRAIGLAERAYYAKTGTYIACNDASEIRTNLGVDLTTENHSFGVQAGGEYGTGFLASAIRNDPPGSEWIITIDQDLTIAEEAYALPGL